MHDAKRSKAGCIKNNFETDVILELGFVRTVPLIYKPFGWKRTIGTIVWRTDDVNRFGQFCRSHENLSWYIKFWGRFRHAATDCCSWYKISAFHPQDPRFTRRLRQELNLCATLFCYKTSHPSFRRRYMSISIWWELTCRGLVSSPWGFKTLICLTLQLATRQLGKGLVSFF